MRAFRTSDTPLASPWGPTDAGTLRAAKTAFETARVNERPERWSGMPSILRKPSPRDALSDTRLRPAPAPWLCHHGTGCRRLCYPLAPLRAPWSLGSRPRAPLPREARFSEPRRRSPTSATLFDARTRRRAVDPRTRVRLSPRYLPAAASEESGAGCVGFVDALPHPEPASRNLHTAAFTVVFHLRGRSRSRAGALEEGERALFTIARALLAEPRAPGSPARLATWPGRPDGSSYRPRLFLNATSRKVAPSRESRCLPSRENPYAKQGLLPVARLDRCSVTRPLWRRCSGAGVPL